MKAKVVKQFPGVPDGQVMPRLFQVGDIVTGDLARAAIADGSAVADAGEKATEPPAAAANDAPVPRRARTTRVVMIDGTRTAKGAVVEGALAEQLIAEGAAVEIKDKGAAPEAK